ncbi:MAG: Ig-like domain-containing protein [Ruminococcus sp.]
MKKIKKLTAVFLAVIITLGVLTVAPFTVSAAGTNRSISTNTYYTDRISDYNETDIFNFSVSSPSKVSINVQHNLIDSSSSYWSFKLCNMNGDELISFSPQGNKTNSTSYNTGIPKGNYYIKVSRGYYHSNIDYTFKINCTSSSTWETETNNSYDYADSINLNTYYNGTVNEYNDVDYYKFYMSNSSKISINVQHNSIDSSSSYWSFKLCNMNGDELISFSPQGNKTNSTSNAANISSGNYYIKVSRGYYHSDIDYSFSINTVTSPTSVKITPTSLTLGAEESYTLTKSVSPSNASTSYTWSSSNTSVATVSNGKVTAKNSGTANITVKTSNGKTAQCKVTVKPAPTSVKTNPSSVTLGVGETYTVSESTNSGSYANAANLKWSTSNSSVATVTKGSANKATITAKGIGTAYIKITLYNGKTAQCKVTVKSAPTSVTTNPASVTLGVGETYTVSESTNSGSYANAANLKWSTSNSSVATVTKGSANKATITAKGVGTAYIKITLYNGKTAQCKVTVKNAPSSVSLSKTSLTLSKGATYTISETTNSGSYANAANLKWSSSNTSVATVTKGSGNKATITAKSKGTAYIKITLYNGKTAQCKVTVK